MMRLAIVGDSLGLPRFAKGLDKADLYYEDTYPELLRRYLMATNGTDVMLVNLCRHAQTTLHLLRGVATDIYLSRPQAVIVELGLTDLWPARGRRTPPPFPELSGRDPWIDAAGYRDNLDRFLGFCRHAMNQEPPLVILVNLWAASPAQYERYPEARSRTAVYNAILDELAARHEAVLFDANALLQELGEEALAGDGIHWTSLASTVLAKRLGETLLAYGDVLGEQSPTASPGIRPQTRAAGPAAPQPDTGVSDGNPT
jgi:lysophospholipase L1-like esterase